MTIEDAIAIVDAALQGKRLSNIQEQLFRQTWEGKTYSEIAEMCGYDSSYIRDVGYRLWQMLTKGFGERVTKHNLQVVVRTHAKRFQGDVVTDTLSQPFTNPLIALTNPHNADVMDISAKRCDWGNAIDTSIFYVRTDEL